LVLEFSEVIPLIINDEDVNIYPREVGIEHPNLWYFIQAFENLYFKNKY